MAARTNAPRYLVFTVEPGFGGDQARLDLDLDSSWRKVRPRGGRPPRQPGTRTVTCSFVFRPDNRASLFLPLPRPGAPSLSFTSYGARGCCAKPRGCYFSFARAAYFHTSNRPHLTKRSSVDITSEITRLSRARGSFFRNVVSVTVALERRKRKNKWD